MEKVAKTKAAKDVWFTEVRDSYLPASWQGWLCYVPFTVYLVFTLIYGLTATNSFWQGLLIIVPGWVAAVAVMNWVAKKYS